MAINITPLPGHRHCVAVAAARASNAAARRALLEGNGVCGDFRTNDTALPAAHKTTFHVSSDGRDLLVAVCLHDIHDALTPLSPDVNDTVEILFDPFHDHIGYYQFVFSPTECLGPIHHAPYAEAHSTAYAHMAVKHVSWDVPVRPDDARTDPAARAWPRRPAWLFVRFALADVFRAGDTVGFNVARTHAASGEAGTWNPASGHGMQDAAGFGVLSLTPPVAWAEGMEAKLNAKSLSVSGTSSTRKRPTFRLINPRGDDVSCRARASGKRWSLEATLPSRLPGRYRLYATVKGATTQPRYVAIDVPARRAGPTFVTGMTYDVPDDMRNSVRPYTPDALDAELQLFADHGISRIHWIDYPPETLFSPRWLANMANARGTEANCGDLLELAARQAKKKGLAFIGVFKPFDIAIDGTHWAVSRAKPSAGHTVRNLEGNDLWVPAAVAANQNSTFATHPDWVPAAPALPARPRLRLYSRTSIPPLRRRDIRLWVSPDNRDYTPYRGKFALRQGRARRPHMRWTPAGNVAEPGTQTNSYLELSAFDLTTPYLAIEIRKPGIVLTSRAHAFVGAWDENDAPVPITLATAGDRNEGFSFWQEWQSWANKSPRMLEDITWTTGVHGLVFDAPRRSPTLLEPASPATREIWLQHVRRILDTEADGVGIRTLSHHNNVMDHMRLAFAEPVREAFRERHGREPTPAWEDCVLVRELRGDAYTQFLRDAKGLASKAGKKLAVWIEAGVEVPPTCDQRMQINLDWKTWIQEGIADELVLKWWFSQSPFIHEHVLPLARRHGIPVHIVDRNSSLNRTMRAVERADALTRDSAAAGFAGYHWYEAADYQYRNAADRPCLKTHTGDAIRRAARIAREWARCP